MLNIRLSKNLSRGLAKYGQELPRLQRLLVQKLALDVVGEVMLNNPVDTGRSRMGWVAPIRRFGAVPMRATGRTRGGPIREDRQAEGERASRVFERETGSSYTVSVENPVFYVPYIDQRKPYIRRAVTFQARKFRSELRRDVQAFLRSRGERV